MSAMSAEARGDFQRAWRWAGRWREAQAQLPASVRAALVEGLAVVLVRAVVQTAPGFDVIGALPLLAIVMIGVRWGEAPAGLATLLGTGLLTIWVMPWTANWVLVAEDAGQVGVFLMTGLLISLVVGRQHRAHDHAVALAASLTATNRDLAAARQRMDDFLSVASHELKTPLTSASGYVQLCRLYLDERHRALTAEETAHLVGLLRSAERSMNRLVRLEDDLLNVSRIEAGRLTLHRQPIDLAQLLRECIDTKRLLWAGRTLTLAGADQPFWVLADADLSERRLPELDEQLVADDHPLRGADQLCDGAVGAGVLECAELQRDLRRVRRPGQLHRGSAAGLAAQWRRVGPRLLSGGPAAALDHPPGGGYRLLALDAGSERAAERRAGLCWLSGVSL
jgi:signal transduction histidine kinase